MTNAKHYCTGCPVSAGTHKPADAVLTEIAEPAPQAALAALAAVPDGWKLVPIKVPDSAFALVSGGYPAGYKAGDKRDTAVVHERAQRTWEAILNGITAPAHPAEGVPAPVVEDLIDRLQDAQQDINLAANTHMSQPLASAAVLLDEVERTLRALAATPAAGVPAAAPDARDGWIDPSNDLPNSAMQEVLVLQMFFEEDGTARNVCRGETDTPLMRNIAKAHCHKGTDGAPTWRGEDTGIITRKGWKVVGWRDLPQTEEFCAAIAQTKQAIKEAE